MSDITKSYSDSDEPCPAMTFEEARLYHLLEFAALPPEQKIRWLGEMLEVAEMARAARKQADRKPAT